MHALANGVIGFDLECINLHKLAYIYLHNTYFTCLNSFPEIYIHIFRFCLSTNFFFFNFFFLSRSNDSFA